MEDIRRALEAFGWRKFSCFGRVDENVYEKRYRCLTHHNDAVAWIYPGGRNVKFEYRSEGRNILDHISAYSIDNAPCRYNYMIDVLTKVDSAIFKSYGCRHAALEDGKNES